MLLLILRRKISFIFRLQIRAIRTREHIVTMEEHARLMKTERLNVIARKVLVVLSATNIKFQKVIRLDKQIYELIDLI